MTTPAEIDYYRQPNYIHWLRAEATLIDTDGCSAVSGLKVECCYEHDLSYFYAKDPREAYRRRNGALPGSSLVWSNTPPITFEETNRRFRKCLQARSKLGRYSPMALWRWAGVAWFPASRASWDAHRQREKVQANV
jgi:hypothetical protein